jgi:hypothetical protein
MRGKEARKMTDAENVAGTVIRGVFGAVSAISKKEKEKAIQNGSYVDAILLSLAESISHELTV